MQNSAAALVNHTAIALSSVYIFLVRNSSIIPVTKTENTCGEERRVGRS